VLRGAGPGSEWHSLTSYELPLGCKLRGSTRPLPSLDADAPPGRVGSASATTGTVAAAFKLSAVRAASSFRAAASAASVEAGRPALPGEMAFTMAERPICEPISRTVSPGLTAWWMKLILTCSSARVPFSTRRACMTWLSSRLLLTALTAPYSSAICCVRPMMSTSTTVGMHRARHMPIVLAVRREAHQHGSFDALLFSCRALFWVAAYEMLP
jgi:hypothetical protein